jgi:hydrogenase maturation factor
MCLAIPGGISALHDNPRVPMAKIDFDGITREACLSCPPDARIGEYVLVHHRQQGGGIVRMLSLREPACAQFSSTWMG